MLKHYIFILEKEMREFIPYVTDKKTFLWVLGSLFLLGIVSKCLVYASYGSLIKKADNMSSPKSNTLRQIKLKFESVKMVNGTVPAPMLLVKRYISRCRFGGCSLNLLNQLAGWCSILCVGYGGVAGYILYSEGAGKTTAMSYILVGCFFGIALLVAERSINTSERQNELMYIITDFFENSVNLRDRASREENYMVSGDENVKVQRGGDNGFYDEINENVYQRVESMEKEFENKGIITREEEKIINEVLGEFLQ